MASETIVAPPAAARAQIAHIIIKHRQCHRSILDKQLQPFLALLQIFRGPLSLGDVNNRGTALLP